MKNKKIITISIITIITFVLATIFFLVINKKDEKSTLTIIEKQWIEKNKNDVIDLAIINNIPVFDYDGKGIFFDFINSIEASTGLNFNKLSYEINENVPADYSFRLVDKVSNNDIKIYEDNYVLLTKKNIKYNNLKDIDKMTIGVLSSELNLVNEYLKENKNISYKNYENNLLLFDAIEDSKNLIDGIIVPKTIYLKQIVENENLNISYNISEMKKYIVLHLGNSKKLNKIIKKYFEKWYKEEYVDSYNENFSDSYFSFKQIYEQDKVNFKSKRYEYAFIEYAPYDSLVNGNLVGINNEIIKNFSKLANIEVSYGKYKNYQELIDAFNSNKIDFIMNASSNEKYKIDTVSTVSISDEQIFVISNEKSNTIINSLSSLKDYNVITIKDSKIEKELKNNKIDVRTYNNVKDLIRKKSKNDIIVIDKTTYETYKYNKLKNYKIDYIFNLDSNYVFIVRNITQNKIFNEYFNFYLSFINEIEYKNNIVHSMFNRKVSNNNILILILILFGIIAIISTIVLFTKMKPKNQKIIISKEDKLKYIDILTSLKNRNYLNDNMEKWDSSEIYPQSIVIVDLNNVAYINDNYGHEEGDNIIKEAAAILIKTQIENTEIMRTNGNEFLIYMVQYEEKQVVSYIRKLNKELKELKHGFGAALGYSIIHDELKTIDDAINEATLDMKSNKEEIQN